MKARRFARAELLMLAAAAMLTAGAIVFAGAGSSRSHESTRSARGTLARTVSITCPSPSLGGQFPALVYLPAAYDSSGQRYPVV